MKVEHIMNLYVYGTLAWLAWAVADVLLALARHV